jgi:uroporphyrinogen decarboxylase
MFTNTELLQLSATNKTNKNIWRKMNSRERLTLALNHKTGDRIPIDMGGTQTGIHITAYKNLCNYLGVEDDIKIIDINQQLAKPSEEVLKLLDIDTRYAIPVQNIELKEVKPGFLGYVDVWGVTRGYPKGQDQVLYLDIIKNPLRGLSISDLEKYNWPDPDNSDLFSYTYSEAKRLKEETEYGVISKTIGVIFEACWKMRGMEDFLMDILTDRPFAEKLLDIMTQYQLEFCKGYLEKSGKYFDVIFTGDDLGMQNGPIISPSIYREIVKPRQKKVFDLIHSITDAKICYHTCGSVIDFIDDFIEIGIDFLNPVQLSAANMDAAKLKEKYGDKIGFWGGGVDTQKTFSFGSTDQVRKDVEWRLDIFKKNGGYVYNSIHSIQPDVPPENIAEAFKTAKEKGIY